MQMIRILVVVALQTFALAYMIVDRQHMLDASRVATLKVVPVDPQDLFRGDYVVLNYDISRLDVKKIDGDDSFQSGDKVFVVLRKGEGEDWTAVSVWKKPISTSGSDIAVQATVSSFDSASGDSPSNVWLTYGVESYFVPQGTGRAIEEQARNGKLSVDIAIDKRGRAAIKALRSNGKVFYTEGIF